MQRPEGLKGGFGPGLPFRGLGPAGGTKPAGCCAAARCSEPKLTDAASRWNDSNAPHCRSSGHCLVEPETFGSPRYSCNGTCLLWSSLTHESYPPRGQSRSFLDIGIVLIVRQPVGILPEQNCALASRRLIEGLESGKRLKRAAV